MPFASLLTDTAAPSPPEPPRPPSVTLAVTPLIPPYWYGVRSSKPSLTADGAIPSRPTIATPPTPPPPPTD